MEFSTFDVVKTKENTFFMEWDMRITDPPESIDDYKFQIFWSFDSDSGFLAVADEAGDFIEIDGAIGPLLYTHNHIQYDFNKDSYYKIKAIEKTNLSHEFFSDTTFIGMYNDGIHEVVKHAEQTLYQHYYGEPCIIIKRKSFGARCPTCWSPSRQQCIISHCDACQGTGFVTGYYQPIEMQISFDSDPRKDDLQRDWQNTFDTKRGRLSNYPLLRPKDLIINKDDYKRYVVTHVETTKLPMQSTSKVRLSKQNYILSQILTLDEITTDDAEYNIDIDNIPYVPQSDEGGTGSPVIPHHPPVTADAPLVIGEAQHMTFDFDTSDFKLIDGVFSLKTNAFLKEYTLADILLYPLTVVSVDNSGELVVSDSLDTWHMNRVVGIALTSGVVGMDVFVQRSGYITNEDWDLTMGKGVFFGDSGIITQDVPVGGYWMKIGTPISSDTIMIELREQIIRA